MNNILGELKCGIKRHKKKIAIAGAIACALVGGTVILLKHEPAKYSDTWFEKLSDIDLEKERDNIQQLYMNAGKNNLTDVEFDRLYWLLNKFDNIISKRAWAGREYAFPVRSENGWHLPSDD